MSYLHIPRYYPRQLVKVSTVYLYAGEPADQALACIEAVHRDLRDIQAPTYTVSLLVGAHAGDSHELPEMALSPLGSTI